MSFSASRRAPVMVLSRAVTADSVTCTPIVPGLEMRLPTSSTGFFPSARVTEMAASVPPRAMVTFSTVPCAPTMATPATL